MDIPIRNIYFLLCYAWNHLEQRDLVDTSHLGEMSEADLYALVLTTGLNRLLRRGMQRDYEEFHQQLPYVRGRIDVAVTEGRQLRQKARLYCHHEILSRNALPNRIIKATLKLLLTNRQLSETNAHEIRKLLRLLGDIRDVHLSASLFHRVPLHANNRFTHFLLNVCNLIYSSSLIDERVGTSRFSRFEKDRLPRIFEDFLRNFWGAHVTDLYKVAAPQIKWNVECTSADLSFLPVMKTDIVLQNASHAIIVDAKCYKETLKSQFGVGRLPPGNLYQLFAYLRNAELSGGYPESLDGMLVYPLTSSSPLRLIYRSHGHLIRVCTVDLSQDWQIIHRELLEMVEGHALLSMQEI